MMSAGFRRYYCWCWCCLLVLFLGGSSVVVRAASRADVPNGPSAYETLGVSESVDQSDLRRRYRELCLRYHPDKNVNKTERERSRCEERFKEVQRAYSHVGDAVARKDYDDARRLAAATSSYFHRSSSSSSWSRPTSADDLFRAFEEERRRRGGGSSRQPDRRPFYFNGVDVSNLFPNNANEGRSVYVTTVEVPLRALYEGSSGPVELVARRSFPHRYRAAFRGGAAVPILSRCLLSSLPVFLRSGLALSLCFWGAYVHCALPRLERTAFSAALRGGWRDGTRLRFENAEPGIDVVFVLREGRHDAFRRDGDDLVTCRTVREDDLKRATTTRPTVRVDLLGEHEGAIEVALSEKNVKKLLEKGRTTVVVKGRGWKRRAGGRGDLLVEFRLDARRETKRRRRGSGRSIFGTTRRRGKGRGRER